MEAFDKQLTINLEQDLTEVLLEDCCDHQTSIDAHLESACRQSFKDGQRDATKRAETQIQEVQVRQEQELQTVMRALTKAVPEMLKEAEQAIKELAVSVAQKYVATCPLTEERIHSLVAETLKGVQHSSKITVFLNPEDLVLVNQAEHPIENEHIASHCLTFKAAPGITRGGCRIETDFGEIDATVEAKTAQINNLISGPSLAA